MENTNKTELQLIYDIASAVIQCAAYETWTGQYTVGCKEIMPYLNVTFEDYVRLFDDVMEEIWSRDEVLDVYEDEIFGERAFDVNLCLIYCPNIDPDDEMKVDADKILPVKWHKA